MPRQLPKEVVDFAIEEVAKGRSLRDVAGELQKLGYRVTYASVGRWAREAKAAPPTPVAVDTVVKKDESSKPSNLAATLAARQAAVPPPATPPAEPFKISSDNLADAIERMIEINMREAAAYSSGTAGASAMRSATKLAGELRQIQKLAQEDSDVVKIPREELDRAMASIKTRVIDLLRERQGLPAV